MSLTHLHLTSAEVETLRKFALHMEDCKHCHRDHPAQAPLRLCSHATWIAIKVYDVLRERPDFNPRRQEERSTLW